MYGKLLFVALQISLSHQESGPGIRCGTKCRWNPLVPEWRLGIYPLM